MNTVLVIIAVIAGYRIGWEAAHLTVARECERLGAFYVKDKIYRCVAVEGGTKQPAQEGDQ